MARKIEFPDIFTIRLPEGGIAALKSVLRPGETISGVAREAVQTLVAGRQRVLPPRVTFSHGRGRKLPGEKA